MSPDEPPLGFFAYPPDGERPAPEPEEDVEIPAGATIRLMSEYDVEIPLWTTDQGVLFMDVEELIDGLGVSPELAADIERWGLRTRDQIGLGPETDADGRALVARLNQERGHLYRFVYHPDQPRHRDVD